MIKQFENTFSYTWNSYVEVLIWSFSLVFNPLSKFGWKWVELFFQCTTCDYCLTKMKKIVLKTWVFLLSSWMIGEVAFMCNILWIAETATLVLCETEFYYWVPHKYQVINKLCLTSASTNSRLLSNWPATDGYNQITNNYITPLLQIYSENSKAHAAFDKRLQKQGVERLGNW